jgi:hypothetical protein
MSRGEMQSAFLIKKKDPESGFAQARPIRQDCLENGRKLSLQAADDSQHLRGHRLLLKRVNKLLSRLR